MSKDYSSSERIKSLSPLNSKKSSSDNRSPQLETLREDSVKSAETALIAKLNKTSRVIRGVDFATAICSFIALALGILLLGILCDSWLFAGGLSTKERVFFISFLLVASGLCFLWKLVPVMRRRLNALYAAKILEDSRQDKHNLIINWLLLCGGESVESSVNRDAASSETENTTSEVRRAVLNNVTLQAARLTQNARDDGEETQVDCSSLIRWGVALACLAAIYAFYIVFSPKNPLESAARIVAPFADVEKPQALRFKSVDPGDVVVFQGDFVDVYAEIPGANASEKVEIIWSTEDGRVTDRSIPMIPDGASRFKGVLPDAEDGFCENIYYKVVAARGTRFESASKNFLATVRPQPSFRVIESSLKFPKYTGLAPQTFKDQGDIRAVENTEVKIVAQASGKLARAYLLPDGDQTRAVKMDVDPNNPEIATASFTLKLSDAKTGERKAEFESYSLQSEDVDGEKNRDAQTYAVSILPDLPPNIVWADADAEAKKVPLNGSLLVRFSAEDPDYSLRRVLLGVAYGNLNQGEQAEQKPNPEPIELPFSNSSNTPVPLEEASPFVGKQSFSYVLVPEKLGLNVGDELEYWGVAFDSKRPDANVATTDKRIFAVVDPVDNPNSSDGSDDDPGNNGKQNMEDAGQGGAGKGDDSSSSKEDRGGENDKPDSENEGQNNEDDNSTGDSGDADNSSNQENMPDEQDAQNSESESGSSDKTQNQTNNPQDQNRDDSEETDRSNSEDATKNENASPNRSESDAPGESGDAQESGQNQQKGASSSASDADATKTSQNPNGSSSDGSNGGENSEDSDSLTSKSGNDGSDPHNHQIEKNDPFQKILDYMSDQEEESGEDDGGNDGVAREDSERRNGRGSSVDRESAPSPKSPDAARESENEVDPDFEQSDELGSPTQEGALPTRTSSKKPRADSPVFKATDPGKIDVNANRKQDRNAEENENNFLAQNAQSDSVTNNKRRDANITLDPLDQSPATAADSISPDAPEAKGGSANLSDGGTTEQSSDLPEETSGIADQRKDQLKNQSNQNKSDGESIGRENDSPKSDGAPSPGGGEAEKSPSDNSRENEPRPSSGNSRETGVSHGGGGAGVGQGEIERQEENLAPADSPRLQYAEKATNLVLEYLENNLKDGVDKRLLEELGWTEEEMRDFVEKWKQMRTKALIGGGRERTDYLEALERLGFDEYSSLGVSEAIESTRESNTQNTLTKGGAREASRVKTPDRLSERVRAFTRGVSAQNGIQ